MNAAEHEAEIRAYFERREARQRSEDGWFTLVDRIWLEEGDNALPIGTVTLRGQSLQLTVPDGLGVTRAGESVRRTEVRAEDGHGKPDVFVHAGRRYDFIRRGQRMTARVRDPQAPGRLAFRGIARYPVRLDWRLEARFVPYEVPSTLKMPFTTGELEDWVCPGTVVFGALGSEHRLEVVVEPDPDRLYVLFADGTNRDETYGGGRFFYTAMPVENRVTLDFNKALNPACVFNPLVIVRFRHPAIA